MLQYNKEKAIIFNTYQLYRSDKLEHLKRDIQWAIANQVQLGAKIVRGAYVEKENEYARKHQLNSPIHKTKQDTDQDFNKAIEYCIHNINYVSLCCASHNEFSNQLLIQLLQKNNISLDHPNISASQLQGMSDNITYNMAQFGVKMSKYLPYGPVKEVIPYLIRRSQENTSVEGQTSREFDLLLQEKNRRNL
jgi:proline dehydrogenase